MRAEEALRICARVQAAKLKINAGLLPRPAQKMIKRSLTPPRSVIRPTIGKLLPGAARRRRSIRLPELAK
jgi:hypothetical protein